jgi:hypothetical protein
MRFNLQRLNAQAAPWVVASTAVVPLGGHFEPGERCDALSLSARTFPEIPDRTRATFAGGEWSTGASLPAGKQVDVNDGYGRSCDVISTPFFLSAGVRRPNSVLLVSRDGVQVIRVSGQGRPSSLSFRVADVPLLSEDGQHVKVR